MSGPKKPGHEIPKVTVFLIRDECGNVHYLPTEQRALEGRDGARAEGGKKVRAYAIDIPTTPWGLASALNGSFAFPEREIGKKKR